MAQCYSDPSRESEPHALPDCEVWWHRCKPYCEAPHCEPDGQCQGEGWYFWYCFPGCLPDSDPIGPFPSEAAAIAACQKKNT